MSTGVPKISLEQWAVFRAVVEEGSFAKAAEYLNKSQSSVSYVLSRMQEQLPAPVLALNGRKAELTKLGQVLYRQACILLEQASQLDRTAEYVASGWEPEITLAVDAISPLSMIFCALNNFSKRSPTTRVRILETTLSGTEQAILERQAQIAITATIPVGFFGVPLWKVRMLAVVSPLHALAKISVDIDENELSQHRQIVVRDTGTRRNRDAGWLKSEQRWTVSHFASSVEAVKAGLGFAFIPVELIQREMENEELVPLSLTMSSERQLMVHLVMSEQTSAGPAAQALAEEIRALREV